MISSGEIEFDPMKILPTELFKRIDQWIDKQKEVKVESEDTLADIEVIKQLLAREGFLDSDFQIPTPKP